MLQHMTQQSSYEQEWYEHPSETLMKRSYPIIVVREKNYMISK